MALISGILVGLIFVTAVAGLVAINNVETRTVQNLENSEKIGIPNSEDKIVKALNDFDSELSLFFSNLKEEIGL